MLEIFTEKCFTSGLQCGGDNEAVVKAKPETSLDFKTTLIQTAVWVNFPQRRQDPVKKLMCVFKLYRNLEFLRDDVQRFLHDLKTDLCIPLS